MKTTFQIRAEVRFHAERLSRIVKKDGQEYSEIKHCAESFAEAYAELQERLEKEKREQWLIERGSIDALKTGSLI